MLFRIHCVALFCILSMFDKSVLVGYQTSHAYNLTGATYPVYAFVLALVVDLKEMLRLRNHNDFKYLVQRRLQFSFQESSFEIRTPSSF